MSRRARKKISVGWLIFIALVVCVGAGAIAYYMTGLGRGGGDQPHKKPIVYKRPIITPVPMTEKITVYIAAVEDGRPYLKPVGVEVKEESGDGKLNQAIEALIAEDKKDGAGSVIPSGTELLSPIEVSGRTASINLSQDFVDNFNGGSAQEGLTLNAIAYTIVSNSDGRVSRVKFLVEGETVETLGGHYGIDKPFVPEPGMSMP